MKRNDVHCIYLRLQMSALIFCVVCHLLSLLIETKQKFKNAI